MSNGVKKFWSSKKFWLVLIFLVLLIAGLFVYFFWFSKIKIPEKLQNQVEGQATVQKPVSSIYRYDFEKREYFADEGESWQNSDFSRYVYDLAPEGSKLDRCYYFLYDNVKKEITGGGQRKCNANLTITVGENKNCFSQGENACTLYVYVVDNLGNQGEMTTATYHIDWEKPQVGKVYTKENEEYPIIIQKGETENYKVEISDNTGLNYCWFYLDGERKGTMKIEPFPCKENTKCQGILNYAIQEGESHTVFVRCADHYNAEKKEYLNIAFGESADILLFLNHPPKISSCRVIPTQGDTKTNFNFEVEASDQDRDTLFYSWDFGDGKLSNEQNPIHQYISLGTYTPKIIVSDGKGEEAICSTAWVVVSEE